MSSFREILYLSRHNIEELNIPITEVIRVVENAFIEKAEGRTEVPPKPPIHPQKDAFIHAMPAYIPKMKSAGIKWVSGFPENPKHGLPYISGLLILNDTETGFPTCVMDCTWITAKRTGAATAIAAKHLARQDSKVLGILGCGVQGRSNLEALRVRCKNLEEVKAYDISERNLDRYVEEMTAKHGLKVVPVSSPKEAVENCDIIVTSGPILKHPHPIIEASRKDDFLPQRILEEPLPDGPCKGQIITTNRYNKMLDDYYSIRGWDRDGMPTKATLENLDLADVASLLKIHDMLPQ